MQHYKIPLLLICFCLFIHYTGIGCNPSDGTKNSKIIPSEVAGISAVSSKRLNKNLVDKVAINKNDSIPDELIYKKVEELPDLKKIIARTDTVNKVMLLISSRPDKKNQYYWVQIGINNKQRFIPLYNLLFNPKLNEIKYYDPINDTIVSLEEWRKKRGW